MKSFTTIKVGYTAGIYGNSGEYFTTIILDGKKNRAINHYGTYGSEDRVNNALKELGYVEFYTPSDYGKMVKKDINMNLFMHENAAIEYIKSKEFKKSFRNN